MYWLWIKKSFKDGNWDSYKSSLQENDLNKPAQQSTNSKKAKKIHNQQRTAIVNVHIYE